MALTKVFRIELTGGKDVEKDIISIKKAMTSMASAIAKAKGELAQLVSTKADPGAISSLTAKISDLEAKMKSLSQQRKTAETDAKRQAEAEKILADVKLKEAQASKAQKQADLARNQSMIAQEKELDRQIDREAKEQQAIEKKKKALDGLPGSYNAIKNALNELRPLIQKGNETSNVNFQGKNISFDQAIAEYKRLSAAEQEFRRQFVKDGTLVGEYTTGIVQAFKHLNIDDIIKNQVTGAKQQLGDLESKTQQLVVAYRQAQQQGGQDLNKLQKEIHDNVVETEKLKKAVGDAEVQLKGIGGVGEQITGSINKGFKELKNSLGQFALTYVGFQAVFSGLQSGVDNAKELSDQTTNLEVELGKAKGGASGLVDELGKLNTRTKLSALEDIANIAAKAGVGENSLVGVTQAIDKIKVAFGKDFGDVEQGTESLVKLINIFLGPGAVTGDNLLKMGNAIRTLANESVASVPFLNDFSKRMAGLKGIADISLPSVLGLASGFEQFGQNAEVSSTALVKIIPKLAGDTEKFSKIAGVTQVEFSKLLKNNPAEALLKVSEGLVKGKGSLEEFAAAFKDSELGTGRVESVIGVLGKNTEQFRKSIDSAGRAFNNTSNIETAFAAKNENLAATLDKIGKKFADAAAGKGFQLTLMVISGVILTVINSIPALLGLLGLLAIGWAVQNKELFLLNARLFLVNAQLLAGRIALGVLAIVQTAYNAVLFITNGALALVTRAMAIFGVTAKATAGPLGIILAVVGLLAVGFAAFGQTLENARVSLSEYMRLQQINLEISREAAKATSDQIASLDGWIAVIKSAATSADTKRKAMEKLIEINPAFRNALKGETIDLNELDKAYGKVVQGIQAKARAEAAATLSAGKQRKVTEIAGLRQDLEIQVAQKSKPNQVAIDVELSDDQKEILKQGNFLTGAIIQFTDTGAQLFKQRFDQIKKYLDKREKDAIGVYQDYLKAQAQAEEDLTKAEEQVNNTPPTDPSETVFQIFDRLINNNGTGADFKDLLKKIQDKKKATAVTSKEYQELLALEKKVRELIKPKSGSGSGSHRNPEKQKLDDQLKLIDAAITEQKNALDEQLANGTISERNYYTQVRDITTNGEQKKIDTILEFQQKYKKALARFNGELAKDVADAEKIQIQAKREANQKLFDIDNKQLEIDLRNQQLFQQKQLDLQRLNPDLGNEQRLQDQVDYYDRLFLVQVVFNQKQAELEKKYGVKSVENAQKRKEELEKIEKAIQDLEKGRPEARQQDIRAAADRQLDDIRRRVADRTVEILDSNKSYTKKARELAKLEHDATKDQLAEEAAAAKISLDQAKKDRDKKLISEKEYLDKLTEYKTKEAALYKVTTNEQVSATQRFINALKELRDSFVQNALGIKKYSDDAQGEQERVQDASVATQQTIKKLVNDAYEAYFKNQAARIEKDKQEQLDTLDREKKRVLARADSEAEKETIERQYDAKRKAVEKKAAEEQRRLALKKATIDFAAAVIKTFAQFGFPLGLIPVAALTAAYFFQRAQIQQQQFAMGGNLKKQYGLGGNSGEVPVNGGVFGGKAHSHGGTDFSFNGQAYNAEAGELSIIRTRNAPKTGVYSISGSQTQIASALNKIGGGINFASGAKVQKFSSGGYLGSQLKAPYFSAGAYLNGGNVGGKVNDDRIERLEAMTEQVLNAVYATDAKPVVLNPGKVTEAQKKKVKDVSTGTI